MRLSWLTKQIALSLIALLLIIFVFQFFSAIHLSTKIPFLSITLSLTLLLIAGAIIKYLKRLEKGSDGEDAVRQELKKLPPGYTYLNDFNYTNQNSTDVVVIGPTGVFTIEVKNYHDKKITYQNDILMGDGKSFRKNVLHQAHEEMKNLQKYFAITANMTLPVHPVLVFTNPRTIVHFGLNPIRGVYVVGLSWLQKVILDQPKIFTQEQCAAIRKNIEKHTSYV